MKELIGKAKEGDEKALQGIIDKYTPLAISQASKYHIPGYDFEDLVQHCYLSIIKAVKLYEIGTTPFGAYVSMAVRNNMKDLLRNKIKHNREVPESHTLDQNPSEYSFTIEDQVIAYQQIEKMEIAMNKLEPQHRKIVIDFYLNSKSIGEISKEIKVPAKQLYYIKKKALKDLKSYL
ncbi:sigma-70 family RNA polymerase sigma factor [Clostridium sediminicola]|uniref:sigma-70 family RNA polymerase sigma factor n=1 Tax=Clostridium sediminicola TaxID=3114879 RepID=UPI0031F21322